MNKITAIGRKIVYQLVIVFYIVFKFFTNGIFILFWFQPILLFQIVGFVKHPSSLEAVLVLCAFVSNLLFGGFFVLQYVLSTRYHIVKEINEKLKGCYIKEYSVDKYLNPDDLEKTNNLSLQKAISLLYGSRLYDFVRDTKVFVLKRKNIDSQPPANFFAYSIPYLHSYIFLRDEPEKIKSSGKFFVYHEIGHTLYTSLSLKNIFTVVNKALYLLLLWATFTIPWSFISGFYILIFYFSIRSLTKEMTNWKAKYKLADEVAADNYALNLLSVEDKEVLKNKIQNKPFPLLDSDLSNEDNWIRQKIFSLNINTKLGEELYSIHHKININKFPLELTLTLSLVVLLGLNRSQATWEWVNNIVFYIIIPLLFLNILLTISILSDQVNIFNAINKNNTKP